MARNFRKEYDNYQGKPEQIRNRSERNKARRLVEKRNGAKDIPASMDVDHKKPIAKGGGNGKGNLRVQSKHANRSFKRTKNAGMA